MGNRIAKGKGYTQTSSINITEFYHSPHPNAEIFCLHVFSSVSSHLKFVNHKEFIKTSINKRAVQPKVMKLTDAQVECQDRARWRKVCSDLQ